MLRMLRITADAPMMIFLNGQPAGEFSSEALYLPAGDGTLIFQAFPMQSGLLCLTAKLLITAKEVDCIGPNALKLFLLPDGQIHTQISFEKIPPSDFSMPYTLRRINLNGDMYATVYFDRIFCFALERGGKVLVGGAFSQKLSSAEIHRRGNVILFCGKHSGGTEFFAVSAENEVLLHRCAADFSVGDTLTEYTMEIFPGLFTKERFGLREAKVLSRSFFRTSSDPLCALAAAIRENDASFAMQLIHPQLRREADFSDFAEFFGDFCEIYPTENPNSIGLCYRTQKNVFTVRLLQASIKDGQIVNISESEK